MDTTVGKPQKEMDTIISTLWPDCQQEDDHCLQALLLPTPTEIHKTSRPRTVNLSTSGSSSLKECVILGNELATTLQLFQPFGFNPCNCLMDRGAQNHLTSVACRNSCEAVYL